MPYITLYMQKPDGQLVQSSPPEVSDEHRPPSDRCVHERHQNAGAKANRTGCGGQQSGIQARTQRSIWETIFQYAGIIGIDPSPFTVRELDWMVQGRGEFEWSMTAHQMALQINMNRRKGSPAIVPSDLNPFVHKRKRKITLSAADSMEILKKTFCANAK